MAWNPNLPAGTSTMADSDDALRANFSVINTHDHYGTFGTIQGTNVNCGTNTNYYKIGNYLIQWGSVMLGFSSSNAYNAPAVTFPIPFKSGVPLSPKLTVNSMAVIGDIVPMINNNISGTGISISAYDGQRANATGTIWCHWEVTGLWQ